MDLFSEITTTDKYRQAAELRTQFPDELQYFAKCMVQYCYVFRGITEDDLIMRLRMALEKAKILQENGRPLLGGFFHITFLPDMITHDNLRIDFDRLHTIFSGPPSDWDFSMACICSEEFRKTMETLYEESAVFSPPLVPEPRDIPEDEVKAIVLGKRIREPEPEEEKEEISPPVLRPRKNDNDDSSKRVAATFCTFGAKKVDSPSRVEKETPSISISLEEAKSVYYEKKKKRIPDASLRFYRNRYINAMRHEMIRRGIPLPDHRILIRHQEILAKNSA